MAVNDQIFEQLDKLRGSKTVIVGVGQILKGDDGAGPSICRQLQNKICAEVIDAATVPENYIQTIIKKAPQNLVIIDAIDFAAPAGTIKIFKPQQLDSLVLSTHVLSPHLFIDMIKKQIEVEVCFIGIQPAQIGLGQPLSAEVTRAVQWLVDILAGIFPGPSKSVQS